MLTVVYCSVSDYIRLFSQNAEGRSQARPEFIGTLNEFRKNNCYKLEIHKTYLSEIFCVINRQ